MDRLYNIAKQLRGYREVLDHEKLFLGQQWLHRTIKECNKSIPVEYQTVNIEAWKNAVSWNVLTDENKKSLIRQKINIIIADLLPIIEETLRNSDIDKEVTYCLMKSREYLIEYNMFIQ